MKKYSGIIALIFIASLFHCSVNLAGGGSGTDVPDAVIIGTIVDNTGTPASDIQVMVLDIDYNPVIDGNIPDSLMDTTDASGTYVISVPDTGTYNIQGVHLQKRTMVLLHTINVYADTTKVPAAVLKNTGSIRVFVPDSISSSQTIVFVKGTTLVRGASNTINARSDESSIYIDSLPESELPGLYFANQNNLSTQYRLTDTIQIVADDTSEIDAFIYWKKYTATGSGLQFDTVIDMAIAGDGTKWFALFDKGIVSLRGSEWNEFNDHNAPLPSNSPRKIALQDNGTLWFAMYRGIASYSNGIWTAYTRSNSGIPSDYISYITCGIGNSVWVGMQDSGAVMFNGTEWKRYDTVSSLIPSNEINSICIDANNNVWVGTPKGAATFDGTSWTVYDQSNSPIFSNYVMTILIDSKNNIWFTHGGGISTFNGSSWRNYSSSDCAVLGNSVWNMYEDASGVYWFLTEKGMASFDEIVWKIYGGKRYALLDEIEIFSITEDSSRNRWVCTGKNGIVVFGPMTD